jgi:hypothetical protein
LLKAVIRWGRRVVDWINNPDTKLEMKRRSDDRVYDHAIANGLSIPDAALDLIVQGLLDIAKARDLPR